MLVIVELARHVGSFLCFQWEEATFRVGNSYFPVCAGCFGIYLGSLIALTVLPFLKEWSKKLYSFKLGVPLILPMVTYWAILNIERTLDAYPVPAIKELYSFTGVLLGLVVANAALNLSLETPSSHVATRFARKYWILAVLAVLTSFAVFFFYPFENAAIFAASLVFILGFLGIATFSVLWVIATIAFWPKQKTTQTRNALAAVVSLTVIVVCFMFFQVLIAEGSTELAIAGLFFGIVCFAVFGYSLRQFSLADLGIVKKNWIRHAVCGSAVGLALFGCYVGYRFVASSFQELIFPREVVDALTVLVVFVIVVSEEFFFRGYALQLLRRHLNTTVSVLFSSFLFVLYHEPSLFRFLMGSSSVDFTGFEHVLILFAAGLLLSYFFVEEKSLTTPVAIHLVWNLLTFSSVPNGSLLAFPP